MKIPVTKKLILSACILPLCFALIPNYNTANDKETSAAGGPSQEAGQVPASDAPVEYSVPIVYYCQSDPQWGSYLFGGSDPLSAYGCGPTVVAMFVSTLSDTDLTPPQAADWAAANGYWASQSGSAHSLIPDAAVNFGLKVETLNIKTPDALKLTLSYKKLVVFLMGPGDFTDSGHFVVAYGLNGDGTIKVADPARPENLESAWDAASLLSQISSARDAAGPVWVISR